MKKYNTGDSQVKPPVVMLIYGQGGVGKTTFGASSPNPILMDCENGAKYFGLRGIKLDVAVIESWPDVEQFYKDIKDSDYDTIIIDPVGELMEKLKAYMISQRSAKLVMRDGTPTIAGWGWMKDKMRSFIKATRDLGKHVVIVAHVAEKDDDGKMVKRPMIMTKISEELINIVDIVGWMTTVSQEDGEEKRVIYIQPSDRYEAKDRTGQLGGVIEPDFSKIVDACQGNKIFAWSSDKAKEDDKKKKEKKDTPDPDSAEPKEPKEAPEKPQDALEEPKQPEPTKEPEEPTKEATKEEKDSDEIQKSISDEAAKAKDKDEVQEKLNQALKK